jgi:hypothetical protein
MRLALAQADLACLFDKTSENRFSGIIITGSQRIKIMKTNYQFEKRQRDLEKKKKKAEKALKKSAPAEPVEALEAAVLPEKTD